jgi:predicted NUDIX family NTP pyrophosphohydrolase
MPGKTAFKKNKGWKKYEKAVNSRNFNRLFKKNMRKATQLNSLAAKRSISHTIKRGNFVANAPLTLALKQGNTPLVDTGRKIFKSVKHKILNDTTAWIGVLKTDPEFKIIRMLNAGGAIPVTQKMRNLFDLLWKAKLGRINPSKLKGRAKELWDITHAGWMPLSKKTKAIIIPARPFLDRAFKDKVFKHLVKKNWTEAVKATLHWMTKE